MFVVLFPANDFKCTLAHTQDLGKSFLLVEIAAMEGCTSLGLMVLSSNVALRHFLPPDFFYKFEVICLKKSNIYVAIRQYDQHKQFFFPLSFHYLFHHFLLDSIVLNRVDDLWCFLCLLPLAMAKKKQRNGIDFRRFYNL